MPSTKNQFETKKHQKREVVRFGDRLSIDINEEGSEAAAATAAGIQLRSMPRVFEFKADHPFLFFLHDNRTDLILFVGRLIKPDSTEAPQRSEL